MLQKRSVDTLQHSCWLDCGSADFSALEFDDGST